MWTNQLSSGVLFNIYVTECPTCLTSGFCAKVQDEGFVNCATPLTGRYIVFSQDDNVTAQQNYGEIFAWNLPLLSGSAVTSITATDMTPVFINAPVTMGTLFENGGIGPINPEVTFDTISSPKPSLKFALSASSVITDIFVILDGTTFVTAFQPKVLDSQNNWVDCTRVTTSTLSDYNSVCNYITG